MLVAGAVILERFVLERPLGSGGSAAVWLAFDRAGGAKIALKILHPELRRRKLMVKRLASEAEFLRELVHPGIAAALGYFEDEEHAALAMEYVAGVTLEQLLGQRALIGAMLPFAEIARIFDALSAAVVHAHSRGVLHRDLKPQNIMLAENGAVKVLDFGIAKSLEQDPHDATTQGRRIGSPYYLSPEGTRGEPATAARDVFALGSVLFELVTLRRAWVIAASGARAIAFAEPALDAHANSAVEVTARVSSGERPRPSMYRAEAAGAIDAVVSKALAIEPEERFATVEALREAAARALVVRRRVRPAVAAAAAAVALIAALLATFPREAGEVIAAVPRAATRVQPRAETRELRSEPASRPVELRAPREAALVPVAAPAVAAIDPLQAAIAELRANPRDLKRMKQLAAEIERQAPSIADAQKRARVSRIAKTSALTGDAEGLEQATRELLAEVAR